MVFHCPRLPAQCVGANHTCSGPWCHHQTPVRPKHQCWTTAFGGGKNIRDLTCPEKRQTSRENVSSVRIHLNVTFTEVCFFFLSPRFGSLRPLLYNVGHWETLHGFPSLSMAFYSHSISSTFPLLFQHFRFLGRNI